MSKKVTKDKDTVSDDRARNPFPVPSALDSVLLKELRMIALLRQVANPGDCEGALGAGMRIHRIAGESLAELGYSSKLNAGRSAADTFVATSGRDVGRCSTLDLDPLLHGI